MTTNLTQSRCFYLCEAANGARYQSTERMANAQPAAVTCIALINLHPISASSALRMLYARYLLVKLTSLMCQRFQTRFWFQMNSSGTVELIDLLSFAAKIKMHAKLDTMMGANWGIKIVVSWKLSVSVVRKTRMKFMVDHLWSSARQNLGA